MKLVSFYTPDKYYSKHAQRLKMQCSQLGQKYLIVERDYGENWIDNVRAKPQFLLEITNKLNEDFVWLDVDCDILRPITFTLPKWGIYLKSDGKPRDFVHYIPKNSQNFIKEWIETISQIGTGSHEAFNYIIKNPSLIPVGYFKLGTSDTISKRLFYIGMYNDNFFKRQVKNTEYIYKTFNWFLDKYPINSLVDFGCGIGRYLEVAHKRGITVKGFEISEDARKHTNPEILPFIEYKDCTQHINCGKYGLVITTEVAEHILPKNTNQFVKNLVQAGNYILFSAAPPGQHGTGHINCRPKSFWIRKFNKYGFNVNKRMLEHVRDNWVKIGVPNYIKNNLLMFSKK